MKRRQFVAVAVLAAGPAGASTWDTALSPADAAQGVRQALERGTLLAVGRLGRPDGFLGNPRVRIPLPGMLEDGARLLRATGKQQRVDDLVNSMNRAAEAAVPRARSLLVSAARSIAIDDAIKIVRGGNTSITDYFSRRTRAPLTRQFLPVVTEATEKESLARKFNAVAGRASGLGLIRPEEANIQLYVTGKALDGLYLMIADEERNIRRDPVGTGNSLLRKAFGH